MPVEPSSLLTDRPRPASPADRPWFLQAGAGEAEADCWRGRRVVVVGLGRWGGGVAVTRWLAAQGASVTVCDQADADFLAPSLEQLTGLDITYRLGPHDLADLEGADLVVLNPAVNKAKSPLYQAMRERGISYTTEINLFLARCPAAVVGVTGTYGKSTTCAMLAAALEAGVARGGLPLRAVHVGGNIGRSLLPALSQIAPNDVVVLELSNAQLEDLPQLAWSPAVAVFTNLSPQHLDRYAGGYADYVRAKLNLLGPPPGPGRVVVGPADAPGEALLSAALAPLVEDAAGRVLRTGTPATSFDLRVPGAHNQANAACVLTVCQQLGMPEAAVRSALATFPGLAHRLQFVRERAGVRWYNDSKATAPSAALTALRAFDAPVVALVGGQDKQAALGDWLVALTRCGRAVVGVGALGQRVVAALREHAAAGAAAPTLHSANDLAAAVARADAVAQPGDVVLFSPGGPSFDAYPNFEHRGQHFIELVEAL